MIRPVRADGRIDAGGVFTPIYRARVVDRIALAAESRVVLIVAPAGYGKSTALRQYLDGVSDPVVRYDLRSDNGSLLGFVRGFADAISEIAPDARKTLSTAYDSARDSATAGAELAMWMHAHIKAYNGTIVIDDLHVAENEKQVSAFISSLVERTKGRVRWIVASRSFLDLPVGSWLAYQEMDLAVDESDLAFTAEEARGTARASRVGVRDEELESLVALTSGWPTALSFALRTSTRSLDLRNVQAVTRELVYRYLAEQVYGSLDEADRRLLADCALLPEIEIDVLEAAGYDDALGMIEGLRHRVAFIAPHADRARVYRMHDLFRDFLLNRLALEGADAVAKRRTGIARAFERQGLHAAALSAYAQSEAYDDIERLLNDCALRLFEEGHGDAIQVGISALRASGRREPAVSVALRGLLEASAGRFEEAETLLRRAGARTEDDAVRSQFDLRLARVMINRGADATETLRGIQDNPGVDLDTRGEAASLLAVTYARAGSAPEAHAVIEIAENAAEATEVSGVRARILQRLAVCVSELGDSPKAMAYLAIATDIAIRDGLLSLASRAYMGLAYIMSEYENDRAKHLWYSQQAYLTAVKSGDRLDMQTSTLQLMSAEAKRGNAERVTALDRQLGELRTSDALRLKYAASSRAMRRAWEGAFGEAFRIMGDLWMQIIPVSNQLINGATCAVYAAADGRAAEAAKIASQVLAIELDDERSGMVSPFNRAVPVLLCALAEALVGRHTAAARALKRVRESSNPQIESFRGAIARALRVLKTKTAEEAELADDLEPIRDFGFGGYAMLIQGAVARVLSENAGAVRVSLTRAEVAILKSLATGLSPKEIAQESGRSIYTVQAHVQNAMEKLGCHGRHEAVVAAQRLGVIES
jgi:ATP/maltotriose-dependent transcriptional regulator MalT